MMMDNPGEDDDVLVQAIKDVKHTVISVITDAIHILKAGSPERLKLENEFELIKLQFQILENSV